MLGTGQEDIEQVVDEVVEEVVVKDVVEKVVEEEKFETDDEKRQVALMKELCGEDGKGDYLDQLDKVSRNITKHLFLFSGHMQACFVDLT